MTPEERKALEAELAQLRGAPGGAAGGDSVQVGFSQEPPTSWELAHPPPAAGPPAPVPAPGGAPQPVQQPAPAAAPVAAPVPAAGAPEPTPTDVSPETAERNKERQRIAAMDDWTQMPELESWSVPGAMTAMGTAFSFDPARIEKIVRHNFPSIKVRTVGDSMVFTSPSNGKEYGYSPGINRHDVRRGATGAAVTMGLGAMLPAVPGVAAGGFGAAALSGAGAGLLSETAQYAAGGGFKPGQVIQDAVTGGILHGMGKAAGTAWAMRPGAARVNAPALPAAAIEGAEAGIVPTPMLPPGAPAAAVEGVPTGIVPTPMAAPAPAVTRVSPVASMAGPDFIREALERGLETAKRMGIEDKIEDMLASGRPASGLGGVARLLGVDQEVVNAVRIDRGIPSMNEGAEWAAWLKQRARLPGANVVSASAAIAPEAPPAPAAIERAPGVVPTPMPAAPTMDARTAVMRGARGSVPAQAQVAADLTPDPGMVAAKKALKIADGDLQPTMMAGKGKRAQETVAAIEGGPGANRTSAYRLQADEGSARAAAQVRSALEEVGAQPTGVASQKARANLATAHEILEKRVEDAFEKAVLNKSIVKAPDELMEFIDGYSRNIEKFPALAKLKKDLTWDSDADYYPDWQLLNSTTKQVGAALRKAGGGPWKDEEKGLLSQLYKKLNAARLSEADRLLKDPGKLAAANAAVAARKEFEGHIETLLGKQMEDVIGADLFPHVIPAIKDAARGNLDKLTAVTGALRALPPDVSQDMMASALVHMFEKAEQDQPFSFDLAAKFFRRLRSQKPAQEAIMGSLAPIQRKRFMAAKDISEGVLKAVGYRTQTDTGAMNATNRLLKADTVMNQVLDMAGKTLPRVGGTVGLGMGASTGTVVGAGAGAGIGNGVGRLMQRALAAASTPAEDALDHFLTAPEFFKMVQTGTGSVPIPPDLAKRFAESAAVKRLAYALKQPVPKVVQDLMKIARPVTSMAGNATPPIEDQREKK